MMSILGPSWSPQELREEAAMWRNRARLEREEAQRLTDAAAERDALARRYEAEADKREGIERPKLHPDLDAIVHPVMDND